MATNKYSTISFPISTLIGNIESGHTGLPELQRPFVWERAQVRDLLDSLYRGYPTGHFLFWQATPDLGTTPIGSDAKQMAPSVVVVDGQQRLTSLYAVFKGIPVLSKNFELTHIQIAFNPVKQRFEVANSATSNDPEWVDNISSLFSGEQSSHKFIKGFIKALRDDREVSDDLEEIIDGNLGRLAGLNGYTFNAIQLSNELDIEEVSEIFVRVNSKGTQLNQSDFILTLMSVHWDEGRKQLEGFSRASHAPSTEGASPFNWFLEPSPDQLLRVAIGLGHRRAQLKYAYELLRGKDLDTGQTSPEIREKHFNALKEAQVHVLDVTNWQEYLKALQEAGFRSGKMVTSKTAIVYGYLVFLIGRVDYGIEFKALRSAIARWFYMLNLTSRYTGASETQVEKDIRRFADAKTGEEFIATIDQIVASNLTNDFWTIALPDQLAWSGGFVPSMFSYFAALNLLGAKVLFSTLTVHELLDPATVAKKKSVERHHLFPSGYLKDSGTTARSRINQVANYALLEWPDNVKVGKQSPAEYFPDLFTSRVPLAERETSRFWHALPDDWETMEYDKFLVERQRLMAKVIRSGFEKLATGIDPTKAVAEEPLPTVAELVEAGESLVVEFKSSVAHSYKSEIPESVVTGGVVKTLAAFLNTEGGTLVIGVSDEGKILGLGPDLALKSFDLDKFQNFLVTLITDRIDALAAHRCFVRFEKVEGHAVCLVDVEASTKPVYATTDKGKGLFFVRAGNTTRQLDTKETVDYVAERWGVD